MAGRFASRSDGAKDPPGGLSHRYPLAWALEPVEADRFLRLFFASEPALPKKKAAGSWAVGLSLRLPANGAGSAAFLGPDCWDSANKKLTLFVAQRHHPGTARLASTRRQTPS